MLLHALALPPDASVTLADPVALGSCREWSPTVRAPPAPLGAVFLVAVCAENRDGELRRVNLMEGTLLRATGDADAWQRLVVTPGLSAPVPPHSAVSFWLRAFCVEPGKWSPYGRSVEPAGLLRFELLSEYRATHPADGWAVDPWALTILERQFAPPDALPDTEIP